MAKTGQTKADIARHVGVSSAAVSDWFKRDDLRFLRLSVFWIAINATLSSLFTKKKSL